MKVVLQKDVKNVEATETRVKAWQHQLKVSEAKKKKAVAERKEILQKLSGVTLTFKMVAGEKEKIFGAVTAHDISRELDNHGFSIDRRDIEMEPIKELGQHKVVVTFGEGLTAEVTVAIERATA